MLPSNGLLFAVIPLTVRAFLLMTIATLAPSLRQFVPPSKVHLSRPADGFGFEEVGSRPRLKRPGAIAAKGWPCPVVAAVGAVAAAERCAAPPEGNGVRPLINGRWQSSGHFFGLQGGERLRSNSLRRGTSAHLVKGEAL